MSCRPSAMQTFVWCGIALRIPAAWETGMLGDGYALLEYRFRPVMELKTAVIRGRFSLPRHLKQLARMGRSEGIGSLQSMPMPPEWPAFPPDAQVSAFRWQGSRVGGRGLVHFCRRRHRATLIQFYDHGEGVSCSAPLVLKTFRDHGRDADPSLAVYDIRATLPKRFTLRQFQFEAGRFALRFDHSGERVTLLRWSPADVLLAGCGGDLKRLAARLDLLPPAAAMEDHRHVGDAVEWQWRVKDLRRGLRALWQRPAPDALNALRIWHRSRANRILAVRGEALADQATFERICRSYGIVQKEEAIAFQG
jgi:hypothetical protein